jgi:hypothetical protein
MDCYLVIIANFHNKVIQREVGLGHHPCRDPVPQTAGNPPVLNGVHS